MGFGALLFIMGVVLTFSGRLFNLGRLPGDILIQRGNFTFYFPLVTSLILSLLLTLILNIFRR
ncbi:MAG: hypothetical protein PWQ41_1484 [Bacillota bacterium]|jgi:hypothetical protein|nr:hypothetical protein [Bacillota bacterium]MDK2925710.1 hypothetical protein [Bacillota bacterium]MDK2960001.1 hypothetical protein [Bacillota bacterium]